MLTVSLNTQKLKTLEYRYKEQHDKVKFWETRNFFGVDLSPLREQALKDHFAQPIVGYFDPKVLLSNDFETHEIDFGKVTLEEMRKIRVNFKFKINRTWCTLFENINPRVARILRLSLLKSLL